MTIVDLYKKNMGYWSLYGNDVFISSLIIAGVALIVNYATYRIVLAQVRTNWNVNKCNPIYMPFAGYIMPQPGRSASDITNENFSYCLKQDISMVMSIAMMPFEFALYLVIGMLDAVLDSIMAFMAFIAWLKAQLGGIFATIYNIILKFLIPLIVMMIKVRDALAKANGILVSSLFTVMTIYDITISGILNIMHILNVLMIALGLVIVGMIIFAFIMLPNPFTIVIGLATYITLTLILLTIFIPTIVIYIMMLVFMVEVTHSVAENAPSVPSVKKKK